MLSLKLALAVVISLNLHQVFKLLLKYPEAAISNKTVIYNIEGEGALNVQKNLFSLQYSGDIK